MGALDLDQFTHTFEVEFSEDGSQFLHGQVEFNLDGKVSYYLEATSIPLQKEAIEHFDGLMEHLRERFKDFGGIKRIEIVQKPPPTP